MNKEESKGPEVFLELTVKGVIRDGGTTRCQTVDGKDFYIDGRIGSESIGKLYDRYPAEEGAEIIDLPFKIKD